MKASAWSGERGFDVSKNINGKKRHLLVDSRGLVLAVLVTTNVFLQNIDGARLLLKTLIKGFCKKLRLIWVDAGYREELVNWVAQTYSFRLKVVTRPKGVKGFTLLARCWVVECAFAWLM